MDRLIHTALNSLQIVKDNGFLRSNNLANASVPGFRSDYHLKTAGTAFYDNYQTHVTRGLSVTDDTNVFNQAPGSLDETGNSFDVAIKDEGYFITQTPLGPSLSRRGDFGVDNEGNLINGSLAVLLDDQLQPINIPPHRNINFTATGEIVIEPLGSDPGTQETVAKLGLVKPTSALKKSPDGEIRYEDGSPIVATEGVTVLNKFLEASNVNLMEELVTSIEEQRIFEINLKLVKAAEDIDRSGASLMKMPS